MKHRTENVANDSAKREEAGFTLLELLTTLTIVSVLAAIAFSQFQTYQLRALNARAEFDLRTAITAEEAYFAEHDLYAACSDFECETTLVAFSLSDGTRLTVNLESDGEAFQGEAFHPRGDVTYRYNSETGSYTSS